MRRGFCLLSGAQRALNAGTLLSTVRNDPGMTATYYANRYYGKEKSMQINHLLWGVLKASGKVDMDRADGLDAPPRWYPLFSKPRRHNVRMHNPADEDLSLLRQAPPAPVAPTTAVTPAMPERAAQAVDVGASPAHEASVLELESAVAAAVGGSPGRDIQYYISQLPEEQQPKAPAAFKRLREAGVLERRVTEQGTYVWH